MTLTKKAPAPARRGWKLHPDEVPAELRGNFIVKYLVSLTPEQEASLERAEQLDELFGDGRPVDRGEPTDERDE